MRLFLIRLASRANCLALSLALLTACSATPPAPIMVPKVTTVTRADPPECLACNPWPVAPRPLSTEADPVTALVRLIAQAKDAYNDCKLKLKCVADFQSQEVQTAAPPRP
jgi:hypothetical protein